MMVFFKRMKRSAEPTDSTSQSELDMMQKENDQLLDQVEVLKLDVAELQDENQRVKEQLAQSKHQKQLIRTAIGLAVLIISYVLLHLFSEDTQYTPMLLLIEATFMFMMLQGDDK